MATRAISTTERFNLSGHPLGRLLEGRYYTAIILAPYIINRYLDTYGDESVRRHVRLCCHRQDIYNYLADRIVSLNVTRINDRYERIPFCFRYGDTITIPTVFEFFSSVFPTIRITEACRGTIRTNPQWGVLDRFHNIMELEEIVCNTDSVVEFNTLSEASKGMIRQALHDFRIYTSPDIYAGEDEPNQDELNDSDEHYIPRAIRVFQNEYRRLNPATTANDARFGRINSETLLEMNEALQLTATGTPSWQRSVPYERVTVLANGNDTRRYFPRLGVIPVTPKFNMSGVTGELGNSINFTSGEWGSDPVPRLMSADGVQLDMATAGCAVAFTANMAYTHIKRLVAIRGEELQGLSPYNDNGEPIITPGVIAENDRAEPPPHTLSAPVYFDGDGNIYWHRPIATLLHPYGLSFPYFDASPPTASFNDWLNPENQQRYVAILIFIRGSHPARTGQHWVGANELVTFPRHTVITVTASNGDIATEPLATDTQYFRISPTSINDLRRGGAVTSTVRNNRGVRGWQFRPNADNPRDIYIPLSEVIAYRSFILPQGN